MTTIFIIVIIMTINIIFIFNPITFVVFKNTENLSLLISSRPSFR